MNSDFVNQAGFGKKRDVSRFSEIRGRVMRGLGASVRLATLTVLLTGGVGATAQTVDYSTPSSFTSNQLRTATINVDNASNLGTVQRTTPTAYRSTAPSTTQVPAQSASSARVAPAALSQSKATQAYAQLAPAQRSVSTQAPGAQVTTATALPRGRVGGQAVNAQAAPSSRFPVSAPIQPRFAQQSAVPAVAAQVQSQPNAVAGAPASVPTGETLTDAMRIALAESRSQRALALKNGASCSNIQAAKSLANPKITNATSYVGMLNQPATISDLDLSNAAAGISSAIPSLAPIISQFPTQFQVETPLCDKNFVTSVTAVTLPIYLGGRVRSLTRSAEALAQATAAGEDVGEQAVKFGVAEAYFLVLRTRQLRQVAIEAVQTADAHLQDSQRLLNVGLVTRNVVLAAQVAASEARQTELKIANAQQLAESAYNRLLWRPLDAPVSIVDVDLNEPTRDLDALTAEAVRTRGELQVLSAESRAIQEQEKTARADVLPQVAVVGAYSYFENSHLNDNSNATAAVGMTWTPFDGGTSRARQSAARQNAMAVARVRDEAESAIRLQVRQAWLDEQEARQRVEVARVAVEQAEENLRVVTLGFQEGTVNHTETLDAATMRTAAKSNYTNARYDAMLAAQRLRYAVGNL